MKKVISLLLIASVLVSGCSKYGSVRLKYATPPIAILPPYIHNIAIVNRSLTNSKDKAGSTIETILTGEIPGLDKRASDKCLNGVYDCISNWKSNGFYWNNYIDSSINILIPSQTRFYGTGSREQPQLLDWKTVKQVCDSVKSDALLVLETFNSQTDVVLTEVKKEINGILETGAPVIPNLPRQIKMSVVTFWRLYDPSTQKIIDEYQFTNYLTFNGQGNQFALPPPGALQETAYDAGKQYIQRFLPGYYFITRTMYKSGKGAERQNFKTAFRYSSVADWNGAMQIWQELAKSNKRKNAGRACLNMAVACEVIGKYDEAFQWAQKSYTDYRNKLGRDYANQLKYYKR